jgi:hypothetical protein
VWRSAEWRSPFVSVFADVGLVIGVTADGGVIEGRWELADSRTARTSTSGRMRRVSNPA